MAVRRKEREDGTMTRLSRVLLSATGALLVAGGLVSTLPAVAAELVMFEARDCVVCARFNAESAPSYDTSPAASVFPLRRVDINAEKTGVVLEMPVTMTPTFVFADKGVEMARFFGYPGRKHFFDLVNGVADEFRKLQAGGERR